jgi:hypothetical protein
MIRNKENINNNLDAIFYIVFFFIFAFSASNKSDCQSSYTLRCSLQYELVCGYHSGDRNAVIVDYAHLPQVPEICTNKLHNSNLNLCNEHYRISGDNKKISHSIKSFQEIRLEIEPVPVWRFYFHLTSSDPEDSPFLS